jgi:hypothetical protein
MLEAAAWLVRVQAMRQVKRRKHGDQWHNSTDEATQWPITHTSNNNPGARCPIFIHGVMLLEASTSRAIPLRSVAVVVVLDAPAPSDLNLMQCRLPILHSPLTLSPAATLELDFRRQIRLVFPRTPDTGTTQTHAILSSISGPDAPTLSVLNFIHCRLPILHKQ